jgi:hypothetical protein
MTQVGRRIFDIVIAVEIIKSTSNDWLKLSDHCERRDVHRKWRQRNESMILSDLVDLEYTCSIYGVVAPRKKANGHAAKINKDLRS